MLYQKVINNVDNIRYTFNYQNLSIVCYILFELETIIFNFLLKNMECKIIESDKKNWSYIFRT